MKLTVLGAGAWGTALAMTFAERHDVTLWARDALQIEHMQALRENRRYLSGLRFPDALRLSTSFEIACQNSELLIVATPIAGLRPTLQTLHALGSTTPLIWACKGLEAGSMLLAHQVAAAELAETIPRGTLTGPSFAREVAAGLPAALTLASNDANFAENTALSLHSPRLRVYSGTDLIGAEIGGAVKNVMAIAAGVCDGLQLGNNARAALITRGLAEITRFGIALGARPETFTGLSGLGDLILTCTGDLSRNRKVGLMLAQGHTLDDVLHSLGHVAEGVSTAHEVFRQAAHLGVDMPITTAVCRMLFTHAEARDVVAALMGREHREEAG